MVEIERAPAAGTARAPDRVVAGDDVAKLARSARRFNAPLDFAMLDQLTRGHVGVFDVPCPLCALHHRNKAKKTLRIWRHASDFAGYYCARCVDIKGYAVTHTVLSDTERELLAKKRAKVEAQQKQFEAERIREALVSWREAMDLAGSIGERYFVEHRNLDIRNLELGHCLRWNPWNGCIVALMTDTLTDAPCGVHRTLINDDGSKRFITVDGNRTCRMMRGKKGVIRLSPDEDVVYGLGLVEGIEDALATILSGWRPVWTAGDKGSIGRFPILNGIGSLTVFSDRGEGEREAYECVQRWREAGREAVVTSPPIGGPR